MDKDIKITLIATGFQASSLNGNKTNEAEISGYMETIKGNEEQMDVPAFLRRAQYTQRHVPATPTFAPAQQKQQQPVKSQFHNSWTR